MPAQQLCDTAKQDISKAVKIERGAAAGEGFYAKYGKRAFDLASSAVGLVLLAPLLAMVACCIKLTSRGPVLYRQIRIGRNGRPFSILKFRSMAERASAEDRSITVAGDPRVTKIGKLLRRYKIDELPQLWNVLRGDMSLVGPRPEVPIYISYYTPEQRTVLSARPGITDPASLAYRHEEELLATHCEPERFYRTEILPDKLARNRAYLRNVTLQNDLVIILETMGSAFLISKNSSALSK
jgi:lipopolysaccharide/colanic/teichoic acid biosynthesis glycosyltransferase